MPSHSCVGISIPVPKLYHVHCPFPFPRDFRWKNWKMLYVEPIRCCSIATSPLWCKPVSPPGESSRNARKSSPKIALFAMLSFTTKWTAWNLATVCFTYHTTHKQEDFVWYLTPFRALYLTIKLAYDLTSAVSRTAHSINSQPFNRLSVSMPAVLEIGLTVMHNYRFLPRSGHDHLHYSVCLPTEGRPG